MMRLLLAAVLAGAIQAGALAADGAGAAPPPPAPPAAPANAGEPEEAVKPPSPLESEPAVAGWGSVRIGAWIGGDSISLRKDAQALEGDRISWAGDLDGGSLFGAPAIALEFKLRRRVFGCFSASWVRRSSSGSAPAGGLDFDGVHFTAGAGIEAASTRIMLDAAVLAWGTVEEDRRLGFALGLRYLSLEQILSSPGQRARETTEALFPTIDVRGELDVAPRITLVGWARGSLFTIAHREEVTETTVVAQYVDPWGRPAGEETLVHDRRRVLLTQVNALLEISAGVRIALTPVLSFYGAGRFSYLNAERLAGDLREDMEWRAVFVELGLEMRF